MNLFGVCLFVIYIILPFYFDYESDDSGDDTSADVPDTSADVPNTGADDPVVLPAPVAPAAVPVAAAPAPTPVVPLVAEVSETLSGQYSFSMAK